MVSICGGEPLLYPEIARLTNEILSRGKWIQLCTNGMFMVKRLKEITRRTPVWFSTSIWTA